MNEINHIDFDDIFKSIRSKIPDHVLEKLMTIPESRFASFFYSWAWSLPMLVIVPVILLLFVTHALVIGEYVFTLIEYLTELLTFIESPVHIMEFFGILTIMIISGTFIYLWKTERNMYYVN